MLNVSNGYFNRPVQHWEFSTKRIFYDGEERENNSRDKGAGLELLFELDYTVYLYVGYAFILKKSFWFKLFWLLKEKKIIARDLKQNLLSS